jgi:hypothetical protein
MAAPVMRDDAIALLHEEEHLGVPIIARQWPSVMEHDGLRVPWAPVLVKDFDPIAGCYERHAVSLVMVSVAGKLPDRRISTDSLSRPVWSTSRVLEDSNKKARPEGRALYSHE